jgi:RNA polymerase sigma factor (sigma-70 family)
MLMSLEDQKEKTGSMGRGDDVIYFSAGRVNPDSVDELITIYATPIIKRVLLQRLNFYFNPGRKDLHHPETEDLYQTVILKLITSISTHDPDTSIQGTEEIRKYIATITHNVCNDYLRMKYPERNRLKYKIRDLIRRYPEFSCWKVENRFLCGLVEWRDRPESNRAEKLIFELNEKGSNTEIGKFTLVELVPFSLYRQVSHLFYWCDGPMELENLVHIIARIQGIKDYPSESLNEEGIFNQHISCSPGQYSENVETKELLYKLWINSCKLPYNQRRTIILTSYDHTGESLLHRLLREQIVTITQIYRGLKMTREELISIWEKLPLDTSTAAVEFGTSTGMIAKWRHRALKKLAAVLEVRKGGG